MPSCQRRLVQFIAWWGILLCLETVTQGEDRILSGDEIKPLGDIAAKLQKNDWNFSVDPCSWILPPFRDGDFTANSIEFGNCSFNASINKSVCHVTNIRLKAQSLPGTLPPEFARLPYLQEIDLTRNYLNGTIPPQWSSLPLINISLLGNRLTGPIPKEFGNISTLRILDLEDNKLTGPLPSELGNLPCLQRMLLSSNYFTGELPPSFAKLNTLNDIWLDDNQFNGSIPDFIQNWTSATKLTIQASGLHGPIPPTIKALEQLKELKISDLNGSEAPFPQLNTNSQFKILILRNCNLIGSLPEYLAQMSSSLTYLDLSFNKLGGEIPSSYNSLVSKVDIIILSGNMLTGSIDEWITSTKKSVDLSYNNFTSRSSPCQDEHVNLFASSSAVNNSGMVSCLSNSGSCTKSHDNLFINCGGKGKSSVYDEDHHDGPFFQSENNWSYSTTGYYFMNDKPQSVYIKRNNSPLAVNKNPELYMDARVSPLSLTYYAYCLINGKYNVSLHFAEIEFSAGRKYSSLGRRFFDVYIQRNRVLKDFNIEDHAVGVGRAVVKNFTTNVTDNTLEIRLLWAGRGTTAIPTRSSHGPLISAISANLNGNRESHISAGIVIMIIVISLVFAFSLIAGTLWWKGCLGRTATMAEDLRGLELQTGSFTLRQIKAATNNFDAANMIGEGGFGSVYKGVMSDGLVIAVKQLSAKSNQGAREFVNEIGMISALQHPHLVKLYGCCVEENHLMLVYEYLENNSLARALFGPEEFQLNLDWRTRHRICVGIARGLAYLHEESRFKVVHRDIKATNVLLDRNLIPKISDFGLARLHEEDDTHISTRVAGTFGYMAPEYVMQGYLTDKADVYSFGIVALEIVSGRSNTSYRPKEESFFLLDWAHFLKERGYLIDLIDPRLLGTDFDKDEVLRMIHVALLCTDTSPSVRPAMSTVVSMLEGKANIPASTPESKDTNDEKKIAAMWKHFKGDQEEDEIVEEKRSQSQSQSTYTNEPFTGSSSTEKDLYPVGLLDSGYWSNRDTTPLNSITEGSDATPS